MLTFEKFNPEVNSIVFVNISICSRFNTNEIKRRIYEILDKLDVNASLLVLDRTENYTSVFNKPKTKVIGEKFIIQFKSDTDPHKKHLVYASLVGFNYGYWTNGI